MKVFITGINGFIAGHLSAFLQDQGYTIFGSSSQSSGMTAARSPAEKVYPYKLGDPVDEAMLAGIDVVIHCAHDFQKGALKTNIEGTIALAEAAKKNQVTRQVFISSLSSRPKAPSDYGKAKFEIERYFKKINGLIIRPGTVLGTGGLFGRMVRLMRSLPVVPLLDGGKANMYVIGIGDLCRAIFQILSAASPLLEYNFYYPEKVTMKEILTTLRRQLRLHTLFIPVPSVFLLLPLSLVNFLGIKMPVDIDNLRGFIKSQTMVYPSDLPKVLDLNLSMEDILEEVMKSPFPGP